MSDFELAGIRYVTRRALRKIGTSRPSVLGGLLTLRTVLRRAPLNGVSESVERAVGNLLAGRYRMFDPRRHLFSTVHLETVGGCNLSCPFCPMNKKGVALPQGRMPEDLLVHILRQLGALGYRGRLCLYQNNEPLLDDRLPRWVRLAREMVPKCRVLIETNGTLLREENARALLDAGIHLIYVNNYVPNRPGYRTNYRQRDDVVARLERMGLPPSQRRRILVHHRPWNVDLTNRAGNVPGASLPPQPLQAFCVLPFDVLQVSVDGRAPLCCMDWQVKVSGGDLTRQSLREVWAGEVFQSVRRALLALRRPPPLCTRCDYAGWP